MNKAPLIVIQQKFSVTPGKPAGKFGFLPGEMFTNRCNHYLNLSCNGLCGGFGEVGKINKLWGIMKKE